LNSKPIVMKYGLLIFCVCTILSSCDYYVINSHENHVGVIKEASPHDDPDFKVCYEEKIFPYYYGTDKASYQHGKDSLRTYFKSQYYNKGYTDGSGYVTIRFIINCEGKTGRYEVLENGLDFKEKKFNKYIPEHLLDLTLRLKDWNPQKYYGSAYDSFFYLTFKIDNGEIMEILP